MKRNTPFIHSRKDVPVSGVAVAFVLPVHALTDNHVGQQTSLGSTTVRRVFKFLLNSKYFT